MCNRVKCPDSRTIRPILEPGCPWTTLVLCTRAPLLLHTFSDWVCNNASLSTDPSTTASTLSCKGANPFHILLTSFIHTLRMLSTKRMALCTVWDYVYFPVYR